MLATIVMRPVLATKAPPFLDNPQTVEWALVPTHRIKPNKFDYKTPIFFVTLQFWGQYTGLLVFPN